MTCRHYTNGIGSQIDVSQLPTGMYILFVNGKDRFKFLKK
jgi:hypothetical protein